MHYKAPGLSLQVSAHAHVTLSISGGMSKPLAIWENRKLDGEPRDCRDLRPQAKHSGFEQEETEVTEAVTVLCSLCCLLFKKRRAGEPLGERQP